MGIQDRDYYREHHQDLARSNEAWLQAKSVSTGAWLARLFVLALVCGVVYLAFEVVRLRKELATAERAVQQLTDQMRADRQRAARARPVPAPQPARPPVEFFNK